MLKETQEERYKIQKRADMESAPTGKYFYIKVLGKGSGGNLLSRSHLRWGFGNEK